MLRIGSGGGAERGRCGGASGDLAEHIIEAALLHPQQPHLPAMGAGEVGDIGDDRSGITRKDQHSLALAVLDRLDRGDPRQPQQFGLHRRAPDARDAEPDGVMVMRAAHEIGGGAVGEDAAMGNDDRPAADDLDLFQEMRRDHDRLFRAHLRR